MRKYFFVGPNKRLKSGMSIKVWKIEIRNRRVQVWWGRARLDLSRRRMRSKGKLTTKWWDFSTSSARQKSRCGVESFPRFGVDINATLAGGTALLRLPTEAEVSAKGPTEPEIWAIEKKSKERTETVVPKTSDVASRDQFVTIRSAHNLTEPHGPHFRNREKACKNAAAVRRASPSDLRSMPRRYGRPMVPGLCWEH